MKLTPQEKMIRKNFEKGVLSREGFLGNDTRHIHDIIAEDTRILEKLCLDRDRITDRLKEFIELGKSGLETTVYHKHYTIRVIWDRGKIPCPFGDPGVHSLIVAEVENAELKQKIRYSQLSVHLIRKHGFFGGLGSPFRLNPEELIEFLEINDA